MPRSSGAGVPPWTWNGPPAAHPPVLPKAPAPRTAGEALPVPSSHGALERLLAGPGGLGTAAARAFQSLTPPAAPRAALPAGQDEAPPSATQGPAAGQDTAVRIPPLYCPDAVRDDPALGEEVNNRLVDWAAEVGIFTGRLERLRSHQFGRLFMLAHPDCDDPDRLMAAARCGLAEWSVDDHWVDEGDDTEPELLGSRLAMAHAVVDPVRLPARYLAQFEEIVHKQPVLRAFRSSLAHLSQIASTTQMARLRHELAVMFVGYGQEAEWRSSGRKPAVWEYLLHRYENAFYPCMVLIDPVGGYELPAHEFADPTVRRTYLYAGMANVLLNDVYSMAKEDPGDTNLPNLIAAEENCSLQEAVDRTAAIHDELMHTVEADCAVLAAAGSPQLRRYLAGLWGWMGGSKQWHATSARYHEAN
ncbi:family 2 encapsulin nanocompartment cargo protein terpene cyclase [Streptomyces sp. NPDC055287]